MPTHSLTRRRLLLQPAAMLAGADRDQPLDFSDYSPRFRIEAQLQSPRIKVFDLRQLSSWVTTDADFFTFHQSETPRVDPGVWKLTVRGAVESPREFTLEDLKRRPRCQATAALECAGNSGQPELMNGLVSNAVWSGPGLASLLRECGVRPEAREVVFLGLDSEEEAKWQAGNAVFSSPHGRSLFVQDALAGEPLLALEMNGAPLSPERGFPLRLILPGWYGMSQVKWLSRIEVIDRRYEGRHMARNYHALRKLDGKDGTWLDTSISRNRIKSVVARVTRRRAGAGFAYRIRGAAWGGRPPIEKVEVRIDGGGWLGASIEECGDPFGWLLWSFEWKGAAAGRHTLVSRAIDAAGESQPTRDELRKNLASFREDHSQWPRSITV